MVFLRDETEPEMVFEVVEPGSASDPFSANRGQVSAAAAQPTPAVSPTPVGIVTPNVVEVQANQIVPNVPSPVAPSPAPAVAPATPVEPEPVLTDIEKAVKEGKLEDFVRVQIEEARKAANEEAEKARRSQQSAYDKRIAALEDAQKAAQVEATRREREAKLENPDLTDDEKEILKRKWELDDERAELDKYHDSLEEYYHEQVVVAFAKDYAQYGVTADDLAAFKEPEDIERYCLEQELAFYRGGGTKPASATEQIPTHTVETPGTQAVNPAPAGASAPSDSVGMPPAPIAPTFSKEKGIDAINNNLRISEWETIRVPA